MSWLVALMLLMFSGVVFRVVVLNHTAVVGPYVLYLDQRNQRVVPVGTIISWDSAVRNNAGEPIGQLRDLPKGWRICNGRDGTLDLTSVFLRDDSESGRTGGLSSGNSGSVDPKKTDLNNHKHQLPINNWAGGATQLGPNSASVKILNRGNNSLPSRRVDRHTRGSTSCQTLFTRPI